MFFSNFCDGIVSCWNNRVVERWLFYGPHIFFVKFYTLTDDLLCCLWIRLMFRIDNKNWIYVVQSILITWKHQMDAFQWKGIPAHLWFCLTSAGRVTITFLWLLVFRLDLFSVSCLYYHFWAFIGFLHSYGFASALCCWMDEYTCLNPAIPSRRYIRLIKLYLISFILGRGEFCNLTAILLFADMKTWEKTVQFFF